MLTFANPLIYSEKSFPIPQEVDSFLCSLRDIVVPVIEIGMEAIKKSHEARKMTGKPMVGSKPLQEFLHEFSHRHSG
jgi:hypothetical protein